MATKTEQPSRLRSEIEALAHDMRANGTLGEESFRKITLRDVESADLAPPRHCRARKSAPCGSGRR